MKESVADTMLLFETMPLFAVGFLGLVFGSASFVHSTLTFNLSFLVLSAVHALLVCVSSFLSLRHSPQFESVDGAVFGLGFHSLVAHWFDLDRGMFECVLVDESKGMGSETAPAFCFVRSDAGTEHMKDV
jgi:hypothetical protein